MKIDKVVFSTSESFSVFWNIAARLYKTKLGIEPVCLLFGKKSNTNVSEEFGKVIEMPVFDSLPLLIQITWSKFYWPVTEPDATWLIGDIDLLPLAPAWFTTNVESIPDGNYAHIDADGITQLSGTRYTWANRELSAETFHGCPDAHETNVPGHYHLAKGSVFRDVLGQHGSREHEIRRVSESGFKNVRAHRECDPIDQANLWCAEEWWSSRHIRAAIREGRIKFTGRSLRHGIGRADGDRLDKCLYDDGAAAYACDQERLRTQRYADLHCARPFAHYLDEAACRRRWDATQKALRTSWNDDTITV